MQYQFNTPVPWTPLYPVPSNTPASGSVSEWVGDSFMYDAIASPSFCICQLVNWTWSKLYQSCQLFVERKPGFCLWFSFEVLGSSNDKYDLQIDVVFQPSSFSQPVLLQLHLSCWFLLPLLPSSLSPTCEHMWPAQPHRGGVRRRLATAPAPAPGEGGNSVLVAANLPNSASPKPLQKSPIPLNSRQATIPKYAFYLYRIH